MEEQIRLEDVLGQGILFFDSEGESMDGTIGYGKPGDIKRIINDFDHINPAEVEEDPGVDYYFLGRDNKFRRFSKAEVEDIEEITIEDFEVHLMRSKDGSLLSNVFGGSD